MSASKPVVVYGASGYTGRLVCEYLRDYGIGFIAAGRDKARVQEVIDKVPGIDSVEHEVAEVAHETHLSRITIATSGTPEVIEQVRHQLERLVPVHSVTDLTLAAQHQARRGAEEPRLLGRRESPIA